VFNSILLLLNNFDAIKIKTIKQIVMTAVEFNQQITDLYKNLEYFALSLTQSEDDAQDLLQETYLKALKYRDKFVQPMFFHKTHGNTVGES